VYIFDCSLSCTKISIVYRCNKDIINLETVTSTNDFAKELLVNNLPQADITIIEATEQTKGRGQKGNCWESNAGENLTLSYIIKPHFLQPTQQFFLSMAMSLAIKDCLDQFTPNVSIKWPNDIYVNDHKICGILIENSLMGNEIQWSIIGIGLNINQKTFSEWIPNPTSLSIETGKDFSTFEIKKMLTHSIEKWYNALYNNELKNIHKEYNSQLYLKNNIATYKDADGVFEGEIIEADEFGMLQVRRNNGNSQSYAFKEIEYLRNKTG